MEKKEEREREVTVVVKLGYVIAASGATCMYVTGHLKRKKFPIILNTTTDLFSPFSQTETDGEKREGERGE